MDKERLIDANDYAYQVDLINEPTIDAVKVIRCKECEYWHHSGYCKKLGIEHDRFENDFCSYGVKKYDCK